jgi:hypothetical protein
VVGPSSPATIDEVENAIPETITATLKSMEDIG